MDLIIVVIIGFLLFVLPELLRPKKKQEYEYPEIPDLEAQMDRPPVVYYEQEGAGAGRGFDDAGEGKSLEWGGPSAGNKEAIPASVHVSSPTEERNPWVGQLSLPQVVNGVIFAEILQSPRAKRPIPCWWRKQ